MRIALALLGLALFAWLIHSTGWRRLWEGIAEVGWGLAILIALGGLSHLAKTWAWRFTIPAQHRPRYLPMVGVRLAGEAVAMMSFAGQVVGEATRAMMLRRTSVPRLHRVSSVVIDRAMFTFTGVLVIISGTLLAPTVVALPEGVRRYNFLVLLVFGLIAALALLALRRQVPFASGFLRLLERIARLRRWARHKRDGALQLESAIYGFFRRRPKDFAASALLNLTGHACSVVEVYLVLRFLGLDVTLMEAFVVEALTKVVNFGGFIIPGNLGAFEGGNMVILRLMGREGAYGLTLGVIRRLRGLSWAAVGLSVLAIHGFSQGVPDGQGAGAINAQSESGQDLKQTICEEERQALSLTNQIVDDL
ncbi:MAG TPA: lysylphosphatidylglycerol synthase domain-containing protein [Acidobacteriota bacterium]|nr:lysylphosphatidylglycerol synthase domain-containing protein [Acidobacteriota bacterium]